MERRTRVGMGALEGVEALLLPALDFLRAPANSSYSIRSIGGLKQRLCRVVQDPRAITKEEEKD